MVDDNIPQERHDFYVYALLREDGSPFYIGKGKGRRCRDHLCPADSDRTPKAKIIRRMNAEGLQVQIVKLLEGLLEVEAFAAEREAIARIGRQPNGPLWNLTDGGEGVSGRVHTQEAKAAIAAAAEISQGSPDARERVSARSRANWADPKLGKAMLEAILASTTPEVRAAMLASRIETMAAPEWRSRHSERMIQSWASRPDQKAAQSVRSRAAMAKPEARQILSAAAKAQWADPEARQKKMSTWTPERRAAQAERCRASAASRWTQAAREAASARFTANNPRRQIVETDNACVKE